MVAATIPREMAILAAFLVIISTGMVYCSMAASILPVYKLPGLSTYDTIRWFKKTTGFSGKVGHGGTLDVFACGVVLLLLGEATKHFDELLKLKKTYLAGVRLGVGSTTLDIEGDFEKGDSESRLEISQIREALNAFKGQILQSVPAYSAAKYSGKPLYKYARNGTEINKSKLVTIYALDIISCKQPLVTLLVECSSGTYVRQLTCDIFSSLSQKSLLYFLERVKVGNVDVNMCIRTTNPAVNWKSHLLEITDVL